MDYYLVKIDNEFFIISINCLKTQKLNFFVNEVKDDLFYKFYGIEKSDTSELNEYFKYDKTYPPGNIHPMLQGGNKNILKKFPKIRDRIKKIQIYYTCKNIKEILKIDPSKLFF